MKNGTDQSGHRQIKTAAAVTKQGFRLCGGTLTNIFKQHILSLNMIKKIIVLLVLLVTYPANANKYKTNSYVGDLYNIYFAIPHQWSFVEDNNSEIPFVTYTNPDSSISFWFVQGADYSSIKCDELKRDLLTGINKDSIKEISEKQINGVDVISIHMLNHTIGIGACYKQSFIEGGLGCNSNLTCDTSKLIMVYNYLLKSICPVIVSMENNFVTIHNSLDISVVKTVAMNKFYNICLNNSSHISNDDLLELVNSDVKKLRLINMPQIKIETINYLKKEGIKVILK